MGDILQAGLGQVWDDVLEADVGCIEVQLQQILRRAGGTVVEGLGQARLAVLAQSRPQCTSCQTSMRRIDVRARYLVGLVGDARVPRPYYHCARCKNGVAPLDDLWGLGSGMLTLGLARVAGRDGIEAPFGQGASLVAEHVGVVLDEERVRTVTESIGALADADQAVHDPWQPVGTAPVPETLVVELDGGLVPLRLAWHELKAGRVAPLGPTVIEDPTHGDRHCALGPSC